MRFTHKLTFGFASVSVLALTMAALFLVTFRGYERSNHLIFLLDQVRSSEQALQSTMLLELQAVEDSLERPDPVFTSRARDLARRSARVMEDISSSHRVLAGDLARLAFPRDRLLFFTRFREELQGYERQFERIQAMVDLSPEADRTDARRVANEIEERMNIGFAEMEQSWGHNIGLVVAEIQQRKSRATLLLFALAGVTVAASLGFAVSLATPVRSALRRLEEGMRRVARGDYSRPVAPGGDPEINELVERFNRMAQDLRELEEMRTDFTAMLSHDLKSPLAVVKMYAEALGAAPGTNQQAVAAISRSADRLLRLVENFLDASQVAGGPLALELRPLQLEGLLARVVDDGRTLAGPHKVSVAADLPERLPAVLAEEEHLERALHNLVSNAVKYNRPGGTVTVRAAVRDEGVLVSVADTGVGISAADRARLFSRYFRAERTRHVRGTGLGLAVTREIVRAHGAELEVSSREGEGSTFSFALRLAPRPPAAG
jgi:signal transduction histidine kinase